MAQRDRRPETFIGVTGRHADVGDDQFRLVGGDGVDEVVRVADGGDDVEPEPGQHAAEPFT